MPSGLIRFLVASFLAVAAAVAPHAGFAQQTPATLGCLPAYSAVHRRRNLPEVSSLDDAVPGGDNDGMDD